MKRLPSIEAPSPFSARFFDRDILFTPSRLFLRLNNRFLLPIRVTRVELPPWAASLRTGVASKSSLGEVRKKRAMPWGTK